MQAFHLTETHSARLRKIVRHYNPKMGKSWRRRTPTQLWLKVLSQIVVAGNAAPGITLEHSKAVRQVLAYSRLRKLNRTARRDLIHRVLRAIGTRYVGRSATRSRKIAAAIKNFDALVQMKGPRRFFEQVNSKESTKEKIDFLSGNLGYYKKKGCRDTLIELRLAGDCMALDQRLNGIVGAVGARLPKSFEKHYENIEQELIEQVAESSGLTGGKLDRILFQNYGDIMVRLLCL